MKKLFFLLGIAFFVLLIINIIWFISSLTTITLNGVQSLLQGRNLLESISFSIYLKWILMGDGIWVIFALIYMYTRKQFKTNPSLHYIHHYDKIIPKICVIVPTFNEEKSIERVVKDYKSQKFVETIIVIDNHSDDHTVEIAETAGAVVIKKNENKGFAHSYILGLNEGLKTDANLFLTTESDGTYNGYDVEKFLAYIQNADAVIGTRNVQILTEKDNQNSIMHIWGNLFLAKLIQFKYFSLHHLGVVDLTDVGCTLRLMRRAGLEKIINQTTYPNSEKVIAGKAFSLHLTMLAIENDLRVIEIPVTFNKRIGQSKTKSNEFFTGIKYGLIFLWFILKS